MIKHHQVRRWCVVTQTIHICFHILGHDTLWKIDHQLGTKMPFAFEHTRIIEQVQRSTSTSILQYPNHQTIQNHRWRRSHETTSHQPQSLILKHIEAIESRGWKWWKQLHFFNLCQASTRMISQTFEISLNNFSAFQAEKPPKSQQPIFGGKNCPYDKIQPFLRDLGWQVDNGWPTFSPRFWHLPGTFRWSKEGWNLG